MEIIITKENLEALKFIINMTQYCRQKTSKTKYPSINAIIDKYQEQQLEIAIKMYNDIKEQLESVKNIPPDLSKMGVQIIKT